MSCLICETLITRFLYRHCAVRSIRRRGNLPRRSLAGHLVVHALDVEVHAEDLAWLKMRALAFDGFTVLAKDRTFERMQRAIDDRSLGLLGAVSYTHLRAHETGRNLVCRLLLEKKK